MARASAKRVIIIAQTALDVVEKIYRFAEEPEASQAEAGEQGNQKDRSHKKILL